VNLLIDAITKESNEYAKGKKEDSMTIAKKKAGDSKWFDTAIDGIKDFFCFVYTHVSGEKSCIQLYWRKDRCIETTIRETQWFSSTSRRML
jgi:hypothetical protein